MGCGGAVIKHSPHLSHSRVFGKPLHDLCLSKFSEMAWWAVTWAFAQLQPVMPIFLSQFVTAHPIFADFSSIH